MRALTIAGKTQSIVGTRTLRLADRKRR